MFSPGGKVYSSDLAGLELAWDEKRRSARPARGKEYGRVVQANHAIPDEELTGNPKRVMRRATDADAERVLEISKEARRGMLSFRDVTRELGIEVKPIVAAVCVRRLTLRLHLQRRRQDRGAPPSGRALAPVAPAGGGAPSGRASNRGSAAATGSAAPSSAARDSRRTSSRSRSVWPRIRICRSAPGVSPGSAGGCAAALPASIRCSAASSTGHLEWGAESRRPRASGRRSPTRPRRTPASSRSSRQRVLQVKIDDCRELQVPSSGRR